MRLEGYTVVGTAREAAGDPPNRDRVLPDATQGQPRRGKLASIGLTLLFRGVPFSSLATLASFTFRTAQQEYQTHDNNGGRHQLVGRPLPQNVTQQHR